MAPPQPQKRRDNSSDGAPEPGRRGCSRSRDEEVIITGAKLLAQKPVARPASTAAVNPPRAFHQSL